MERTNAQSIAFWWVTWAAAAVIMRLLSPGILEMGDGVLHYQMARHAWEHPELLLDHWGKPLFTLLASPFAQLGHWGMTLFNALCFAATCWAADRILRDGASWARWLFAPALLLSPAYGTMVLEGMTEVLFGLLCSVVVLGLYTGHAHRAVVVASFLPFARPEYVAVWPMLLVWLAWRRRWSAIPLLAVGHAVYALVGAIAWGEPFWAFTRDPYTGAADIYGSGGPWHFVQQLDLVYGWPLLVLTVLAVPAALLLHPMDPDRVTSRRTLVLMGMLPVLVILLVHSILWWQGAKGSLGLTRVLATGAPLLVLFGLWMVGRVWRLGSGGHPLAQVVGAVLAGAYTVAAAHALVAVVPLPAQAGAYQRFVDRVGDAVHQRAADHDRVIVFHPYVAHRAGLDPFDAEHTWRSWPPKGAMKGDLVVWDAHFGPNEGGVPLDRLLNDSSLNLLQVIVPDERMEVLGGHTMEAFLFTKGEGGRSSQEMVLYHWEDGADLPFAHRKDTIGCASDGSGWCFGPNEFPFEVDDLPVDVPGMLYAELVVSGTFSWSGEPKDNTELIFTEDAEDGRLSYWSMPLAEGGFTMRQRIPPRSGAVRNKLYVWNLSGVGFRLEDLQMHLIVHRRG